MPVFMDVLDEFLRALTLQAGHNTTVAVLGTGLLGLAGGLVGTFAMLRGRTLVADALSHAALPGVAGAFLLGGVLGVEGRSLPLLQLGAAVAAGLALVSVELLARRTRLDGDAATACVLGSSFGLGVVLLGLAQRGEAGGQAGLGTLVFGSTAGMLRADGHGLLALAALATVATLLLSRSLATVAFNERIAVTSGLPVRALDAALAALVGLVCLAGLQAVGMLLVVALLVTPAAAARPWTRSVRALAPLAGALGALSGAVGSALSAALPDAPTGAVITLVATALFLVGITLAPGRGLVSVALRRARLGREARALLAAAAPSEGEAS